MISINTSVAVTSDYRNIKQNISCCTRDNKVCNKDKRSKKFDKSRILATKPNASSFPETVLLPCNFTDEDKKPSCH